jgi:hypothetical protein
MGPVCLCSKGSLTDESETGRTGGGGNWLDKAGRAAVPPAVSWRPSARHGLCVPGRESSWRMGGTGLG